MKISEIIADKYKLDMPTTVYHELLADVREAEEEQEPCEDCISRQALYESLYESFHDKDAPNNITQVTLGAVRNFVKNFPPATPQPKTGHWIFDDKCREHGHCSRCGYGSVDLVDGESHNFCRNCGCRMVGSQESEDKE